MSKNIDLARECGAYVYKNGAAEIVFGIPKQLDAFAERIRADERASSPLRNAAMPVLWRYKDSESVIMSMPGYKPGAGWTPLYAAPQPTPQPAAQLAPERKLFAHAVAAEKLPPQEQKAPDS